MATLRLLQHLAEGQQRQLRCVSLHALTSCVFVLLLWAQLVKGCLAGGDKVLYASSYTIPPSRLAPVSFGQLV